MQWVVTTGRTVEDAKERALDALGIDASELDFEVLVEPHSALFGLRTVDAKVRARVRPTRPRPKVDRRNRKSRRDGGKRRRRGRDGGRSNEAENPAADDTATDDDSLEIAGANDVVDDPTDTTPTPRPTAGTTVTTLARLPAAMGPPPRPPMIDPTAHERLAPARREEHHP